jgi:hypothetical protein
MILRRKIIKEIIPFIGVFLIGLVYVKLSLYYGHFNIDIINYLELSEILTLFLPDLVTYILVLGVVLFILFLVQTKSEAIRSFEKKEKVIVTPSFLNRVKGIYRYTKLILFPVVFLLICYLISFIWIRDAFWVLFYKTFILPVFYILTFLFFEFEYRYFEIYGKRIGATYSNLFFICSMVCLFSIASAKSETLRVEKGESKIISFTFNSKNVSTNNTTVYIGQTKNYLFIYNVIKKETAVYQKDDLIDFRITEIDSVIEN